MKLFTVVIVEECQSLAQLELQEQGPQGQQPKNQPPQPKRQPPQLEDEEDLISDLIQVGDRVQTGMCYVLCLVH